MGSQCRILEKSLCPCACSQPAVQTDLWGYPSLGFWGLIMSPATPHPRVSSDSCWWARTVPSAAIGLAEPGTAVESQFLAAKHCLSHPSQKQKPRDREICLLCPGPGSPAPRNWMVLDQSHVHSSQPRVIYAPTPGT